jgi:hypothetical protein
MMQGEMNRGGHVPEGVTTHGGPYRSFVVCPVRKLPLAAAISGAAQFRMEFTSGGIRCSYSS